MIIELKNNKEKLNDYIKITNIITDLLDTSKKKQYEKKIIDKFEKLLHTENIDNIIEFIYSNKINLNCFIPVNYRQNQIIYLNNNKNIEMAKQFKEYKLLEKSIKEDIIKDKDFIIKYMKKCYKNTSRQKGNLLSKYFKYLIKNEEFNNKNIFGDINVYSNSIDYIERKDKEEYLIFVPNDDKEITKILENYYNLKFKKNKGRDILIKYKDYIFIFEGKEIHEEGGSQTNNYNDLLSCLEDTNKINKLIGAGVLYGACNLYNNKYQKNSEQNVFIITLSEFTFNLKDNLDLMIKTLEEGK